MLYSFVANTLSVCLLLFVIGAFWFLYQNSPNTIKDLKADLRDADAMLAESERWGKYWHDMWHELHTEALLSGNHHVCDICYSNKKKG